MKKFVLVALAAALFMGIGIQNASAANSLNQGTIGLGIDTSTDTFIYGKYLIANDLAILGGFGLGIAGGDAKGTDIAIGIGVRKYLKTADFAPFVGGLFKYAVTKDSNVKDLALLAEGGAEYFLAKQFSLEGSVRFGYISNDTKGGAKITGIGTQRAAIGFNFYF